MGVTDFCARVRKMIREERNARAEGVLHGRPQDWSEYRSHVLTIEALDALDEQMMDLLRDYLNEDED